MICKCCDRDQELRFGYCWDCATAQSIILEGTDMYEKGLDGKEGVPAETSFDKIKLLRQKGLLSY